VHTYFKKSLINCAELTKCAVNNNDTKTQQQQQQHPNNEELGPGICQNSPNPPG
jgi:hypothetical protein